MKKLQITVIVNVPTDTALQTDMRAAGHAMLWVAHEARDGVNVLLSTIGLAIMDNKSRYDAVMSGKVPKDVAELLTIPEGWCVTIEEVSNAD